MRLNDVPWSDLSSVLEGDGRTLVIAAPNFEARSVYFAERILSQYERMATDGVALRHVDWLVLAFQGQREGSLLDGIKATKSNEVFAEATATATGQVIHRVIPFPLDRPRVQQLLSGGLRSFTSAPDDVVIDFTSIPRAVLSALMEGLSSGTLLRRGISPYLGYSWAHSYPEVGAFEEYGRPKGAFTGSTLEELLDGVDHVELVVTTGSSIHDAYSVLGELERLRGGPTHTVRLVNFMNRANLRESWRQLTNHQSLITDAATHGWQVEYAFTVGHVLHHVNRAWISASKVHESGRSVALLVAPFGPKPISVGVELMMADFRQSEVVAQLDVLRTSASQYLSVYSLGVTDCSLFRYGSPQKRHQFAP